MGVRLTCRSTRKTGAATCEPRVEPTKRGIAGRCTRREPAGQAAAAAATTTTQHGALCQEQRGAAATRRALRAAPVEKGTANQVAVALTHAAPAQTTTATEAHLQAPKPIGRSFSRCQLQNRRTCAEATEAEAAAAKAIRRCLVARLRNESGDI